VEQRTAYNVRRPIALIDSSFESQPGLAQKGKLKEMAAVARAFDRGSLGRTAQRLKSWVQRLSEKWLGDGLDLEARFRDQSFS